MAQFTSAAAAAAAGVDVEPSRFLSIAATCWTDARLAWLRELTDECGCPFAFRSLAVIVTCASDEGAPTMVANNRRELAEQFERLVQESPLYKNFHSESRRRIEATVYGHPQDAGATAPAAAVS